MPFLAQVLSVLVWLIQYSAYLLGRRRKVH